MMSAFLMPALAALVRGIDAFSEWTGKLVAWLTLGCVLLCFSVVVLRYGFGLGFIWMQELYVWFHALVFMVGAGYTLKQGGHVRVDALYMKTTPRRRAVVDIAGTLVFLFPWLGVLAWYGWRFVAASFAIDEPSGQPGGMPSIWVLKGVILVFVLVAGLQGLALMLRRFLGLKRHPGFPLPGEEGLSHG